MDLAVPTPALLGCVVGLAVAAYPGHLRFEVLFFFRSAGLVWLANLVMLGVVAKYYTTVEESRAA